MKLPSNYLDNLTSSTYKEYMKLLPSLGKSNTHAITTLIFTLVALIVFGLFAISPTITTIVNLRKQLDDSQAIDQSLQTKITALQNLQTQYTQINKDLPILYAALPQEPQASLLVAQIETLVHQTQLTVVQFHITQVQIAPVPSSKSPATFMFTLQVSGGYNDMIKFSSTLSQFNRLVTLQSISITKDSRNNSLMLNIQGRGYYQQ